MWQSPSRRARAELQKRRSLTRSQLHIQRVEAELKVPSQWIGSEPIIMGVRVVLNDFSPNGLGIFTPQVLHKDQEVAISLDYPKRIFIKAKVLWCQENLSPIAVLTDKPFRHRAGLGFLFASEEDRKAVAQYFDELVAWLHPQSEAA